MEPFERQQRVALEYHDENIDFIFDKFGMLVLPMLPTGTVRGSTFTSSSYTLLPHIPFSSLTSLSYVL